jgi:hypothetical protein
VRLTIPLRCVVSLAALALASGACKPKVPAEGAAGGPDQAPSTTRPAASAAPDPSGPAPATSASAERPPTSPPITDAAFGQLVTTISESGGVFPSENLVSNETSFLHVVPALEAPALRGGAYVGVGPEQNFTYVAALQPELAFVADIRRENLILHLLYKVAFERSATRLAFLSYLFSREAPSGVGDDAPVETIVAALGQKRPDPEFVAARVRDVEERAQKLGIRLSPADVRSLRHLVEAFATKAGGLRYSMEGSARSYPSLGELVSARDDRGEASSFLGSEARYAAVRRLQRENRVVPIVADFGGDRAFAAMGDEMKKRGLTLRVLYASNVEQYLLDPRGGHWAAWLRNVRALPRDDRSSFVRVYFDQGKPHPRQRPGHRTTSLVAPVEPFLERAAAAPFKSFFEVSTFGAPAP